MDVACTIAFCWSIVLLGRCSRLPLLLLVLLVLLLRLPLVLGLNWLLLALLLLSLLLLLLASSLITKIELANGWQTGRIWLVSLVLSRSHE
jgi:hypothetical protein